MISLGFSFVGGFHLTSDVDKLPTGAFLKAAARQREFKPGAIEQMEAVFWRKDVVSW